MTDLTPFFAQWLFLASIQAAITIWPGPAFAMTVRQSVAHGRMIGVFTSLGLGLSVAFYVTLVLCGIVTLIEKAPVIFAILRYAGAAYLIYIGFKALIQRQAGPVIDHLEGMDGPEIRSVSAIKAFQTGFWTNLLNPKAMVFYTAIFAQFIAPHTPWQMTAIYALTCAAIEFLWFAFVAVVLTNPLVNRSFMNFSHWIERACGGILVAMGLKMMLMK